MFNLLVLTEQVLSTYHRLSRMKATLLLEPASLPLVLLPAQESDVVAYRYARLQARAPTAGRWTYQEDATNLPRHAGNRSRVILDVAF